MRRRDLIFAVAGLAASPAAAQQSPAHARLGCLAHGDTMPRHFFEEALARLGWVEGKNLTIERHFADSTGEHLADAAAALVAWRPDVIVAMGGVDARPLRALTKTIPIVVVTVGDPIGLGFATSLARPTGNVTGTAADTAVLLPKLLQLAHELIPTAERVSILGDQRNPGDVEVPSSIGKTLGLTIVGRHATSPDQLDAAIAAAVADGDRAMVVQFSPLTFEERGRLTAAAAKLRLPAVYPLREYAEAGGLISYGPTIRDNFTRAAVLVDKILRGAKPAELPFEEPIHFELVVNAKAAAALGLTIPPLILARADEIIE